MNVTGFKPVYLFRVNVGRCKSHLQNANLFSGKCMTLSFNDQMEDCGESSLATVGHVLGYHQCTFFFNLFIWPLQVLVLAHSIFDLLCGMRDLVS